MSPSLSFPSLSLSSHLASTAPGGARFVVSGCDAEATGVYSGEVLLSVPGET